jgi:hypothetical protein
MSRFGLILLLAVACGSSGSSGAFECTGASCVCPSAGDCRIECLGSCDLQCAGAGACDFSCGDLCVASCTGSGPCIVDVGAQSSVDCTGSGGCDVACAGDCDVGCPGSGECRVHCPTGAICNITQCSGNALTCTDGSIVCGGACP